MYNLRFLAAFVSLLLFSSVTAQENCDTLILHPDRALLVLIDSIVDEKVYCRMCTGKRNRAQSIPLKMVADIKQHRETTPRDSSQSVDFRTIKEEAEKPAPPLPEWLFTSTANKKIQKRLKKGIKIKVVYTEGGYQRTRISKLHDITPTHLVLDLHGDAFKEIPRSDILKLTIKNKFGLATGLIGGLALGVGLGLGLMVAILLLLSALFVFLISGGQSTNTSGIQEEANQGCGWAILAIVIGVFVLLASMPPVIKAPFSAKWNVQKLTEEMKQSMEDQKKEEASESIGIQSP
jgi:hypothetical protein